MRWKFWQRDPLPPCGAASPHGGPQGGSATPQRVKTAWERAEEAIEAIEQAWRQAAEAPPCGEPWGDPKRLALEFCARLQAEPALHGFAVYREWIVRNYALFCRAHGLQAPPHYVHFARELGKIMPRRRRDDRHEGKRKTRTSYRVLAPKVEVADVVKLAEEKRRRA